MECPRCGNEMENGRCMWCAYGYHDDREKRPSDFQMIRNILKGILFSVSIITFTLFMLVCIVVLAGYSWIILPETLVHRTIIFVVFFVVVPVAEIGGYHFAAYTVFLILSVLVSFAYLLYVELKALLSYYDKYRRNRESRISIKESPLTRLAFTFSALLFVYYTYLIILQMAGVSYHTPGLDQLELWAFMYALTRAAVWEEITVRVVFIGLPMVFYGVLNDRSDLKRYLFGGFGTKDRFVIWPILFSSSVFALAHVASWDLYKVPPTFIAGLVFGYLFAKDGLYSCILFHFVWNFTSAVGRLSYGFEAMLNLFFLLTIFMGVYFTYRYIKICLRWLIRPVSEIRQPKAVEGRGERTAGVSTGFVCSNCGNHTAFYVDGNLKCKRCGTVSDPLSPESQKNLSAYDIKREWPPPR